VKTRQVKLKDLVVSEAALTRIVALPISARLSFTLSEVLRTVAPSLENFQKQHAALVKKYRVICNAPEGRTEGNVFTDANRDQLDAEYEDLLNAEVDLPFGKIKLADLLAEKISRHKEGDKEIDDFLKLSGYEIHQLAWLLKVELQPMFEDSE